MKYVKLFLVYLSCFLVQCTFLGKFRLFGVSADLILALTLVVTFCFGGYSGMVLGGVFGLANDICFGPVTGVSALMYIAVGLMIQLLRGSVYRDNRLVLFVLTVMSTLVCFLGSWILCSALASIQTGLLYVLRQMPGAVILNYISVLAVYYFAKDMRGFSA